MIFEALIIGISIGLVKDGRLGNFSQIDFRAFYLLMMGAILQMIPFFANHFDFIVNYSNYMIFAGLILTMAFVLLNHKMNGFKMVILGFGLNLVAYGLNHFKMPILILNSSENLLAQLKFSIEIGEVKNYILFDHAHEIFRFLGKFAFMPDWYPFTKFFGIGDVLVALGIIFFIVKHMLIHKKSSFATKTFR